MRADWIEMGSNPVTGVLVKKGHLDTRTAKPLVTETDRSDTAPKAKDGQGSLGTTRSLRSQGKMLHQSLPTPDFGHLTTRIERGRTAVALRH